jgi:MFS family permease
VGQLAGAALASSFLICTAVSKIMLGIMNDRFGTRKTCSGILLMLTCVYIMIAYVNGILPLLFIAAALSSFSIAKDSMMPSLLTKMVFGARPYARLLPQLCLSMSLMSGISASLIGYGYDWTKSYSFAYVLCALFCLLGFVLVNAAVASGKKLPAKLAEC